MRININKILSHLTAGLVGFVLCMCVFVHMEDLGGAPALRLPDQFGTVVDRNSSDHYTSFFVGNDNLVWGEVVVPMEARSKQGGAFNKILYTANSGQQLFNAQVSTASGWHKLDVRNWNDESNFVVLIKDDDSSLRIEDPTGLILAAGARDAAGFNISETDGLPLARVSPSVDGRWQVNILHASSIDKVVYALLVGYKTMIDTGKAKPI